MGIGNSELGIGNSEWSALNFEPALELLNSSKNFLLRFSAKRCIICIEKTCKEEQLFQYNTY